jgi:putative PIN family toxin of toxin-antitoxin system
MLRVVLDTSTLISFVLTTGNITRQIIAAWRDEQFNLIISPQTKAELESVLARPRVQALAKVPIRRLAQEVDRFSWHVPGSISLPGTCRDPKDDKFIACAVEGKTHYLVSSDKDLLVLRQHADICILNPGEFLTALQLANLTIPEIQARYQQQTLRAIAMDLCLEPDSKAKVMAALRQK